jgi:hypothetical protein
MGWHPWKNTFCLNIQSFDNIGKVPILTFVVEENHWEKGKSRFHVDYGAITKHFGNVNPYQKNVVQQKQFMEDLLFFVAKRYIPIFGMEN